MKRSALCLLKGDARRWLEVDEFLQGLSPRQLVDRESFLSRDHEEIWNWATAQQSCLPPDAGMSAWESFINGMRVAQVRRVLPAWVGLLGRAPADAYTAETALRDLGLCAPARVLRDEWTAAGRGAMGVPVYPVVIMPLHGSWQTMLLERVRHSVRVASRG